MRRDLTKAAGFTLVELVMTLIVVGILAAVVLPRFASTLSADTRGFSDQVRAGLQFARKVAVASGRNVCATTTAATLTLTMAPLRGQGQACSAAVVNPDTGAAFVLTRRSAEVSLSVASVTFRADGTATAAGPTPVTLTVSGDTTYNILIEKGTGHVH